MNRHLRNALMKLGFLGLIILSVVVLGVFLYPAGSPGQISNIWYLVIIAVILEEMTVRLLFRISRDLDKYQEEKHNKTLANISPGWEISSHLERATISGVDPLTKKDREKLEKDIEEDIRKILAEEDP